MERGGMRVVMWGKAVVADAAQGATALVVLGGPEHSGSGASACGQEAARPKASAASAVSLIAVNGHSGHHASRLAARLHLAGVRRQRMCTRRGFKAVTAIHACGLLRQQ